MNVRVRLFARARDLARIDSLSLEIPPGATADDLRRCIASACPALADLLPRCALAVNDEFAGNDLVIPPGAEIAVLPPVSGGQ
jgi:molybdopterin converting factor subunit 1